MLFDKVAYDLAIISQTPQRPFDDTPRPIEFPHKRPSGIKCFISSEMIQLHSQNTVEGINFAGDISWHFNLVVRIKTGSYYIIIFMLHEYSNSV